MGKDIKADPKIYVKHRGNSTTSYYRLVYPGSGSYATKQVVKDGIAMHTTTVFIGTSFSGIDIDQYAKENGYSKL